MERSRACFRLGLPGFARGVCLTDGDAEAPGREGLRARVAGKSLRSALLTGDGEFVVAGSGSAARSSAGCWVATLPSAHETRDAGGTSQAQEPRMSAAIARHPLEGRPAAGVRS